MPKGQKTKKVATKKPTNSRKSGQKAAQKPTGRKPTKAKASASASAEKRIAKTKTPGAAIAKSKSRAQRAVNGVQAAAASYPMVQFSGDATHAKIWPFTFPPADGMIIEIQGREYEVEHWKANFPVSGSATLRVNLSSTAGDDTYDDEDDEDEISSGAQLSL